MEETAFTYPNQQSKEPKSKRTIIIVLILLVIAFIGAFFIIRQQKKPVEKTDVVVEKKEPTPTEKPTIDKSLVKIQVINGTGTPGQAGVVVKALTDAGYKSDNIKTSNAEKFDQSTTTITSRVNFEKNVKEIEDVLKPTFNNIAVGSTILDEKSAFDIVIVTGGTLFSTVTPTTTSTSSGSLSPTPTPTLTPTITITVTPTPTPTSKPTPTTSP